ncbi:hypothetical protein EVC45_42620 [Paraburkholderia sp. UYCP14C]|uniref:M81 family metallopeptidase n=1 Tax=Paraburkholderia sp. UYCP14C TaxID=2511130 RepID=UPI00101FA679|nr:M81 family metallopeptidase [Paraburkholderia sp. UYCP14C]RZF23733.1 hypothetical protein EVC45_42620 [Paraburkholderia sp. UYCP14C]
MKILIARMNHETNTFSPVETPLAAFGRNGPSYGRAAFDENKGMQTAMAAFIDAAEHMHAEIVTPISAMANPSGPVDAAAYDAICDTILTAAKGCDVVSGPLCDPQAVAALAASGVGSTVTLAIGNKLTNDALPSRSPLAVTGVVRALTDGEYVISGPTYTGQRGYMGRAAVLDTGTMKLVVTERTHEPWDLGVFESVGIDPRRARFLLLKSRMYCRPVFVPIAAALVECDSRGVTSSDYGLFSFEHVKRPVYPLDSDTEWPATN